MTDRFDVLLGSTRMTIPPIVYGEQPRGALIERFDRNGVWVERRVCPPVIRIIYPEQEPPPLPRRWWEFWR